MRLASFTEKGKDEIRVGAVFDEKESLLDLNAAYSFYLREKGEADVLLAFRYD